MKNGDRAREAAAKSAASRLRQAPLRRIVEQDENCQKLECGHELRPVSGLFGPTHPVRRRCLACLDAQGVKEGM